MLQFHKAQIEIIFVKKYLSENAAFGNLYLQFEMTFVLILTVPINNLSFIKLKAHIFI